MSSVKGKKRPVKEFPAEIFIKFEGVDDEAFMLAAETAEEHAETGMIYSLGKYRLVETLTVSTEVVTKVRKTPRRRKT
jgi:hypothetical protein